MPNDKVAILAAIKKAEQAKLAEQLGYQAIVKAARTNVATAEHDELLAKMLWEPLNAHMKGCQVPPSNSDWSDHCGLSWDQTPRHLQLAAIEDQEIRFSVYFFSELFDHCERWKAAARFFGLFGVTSETHDMVFGLWALASRNEAMELPAQTPNVSDIFQK